MKKLKFVVVLLVMMIIISGCIANHNDINEEKNEKVSSLESNTVSTSITNTIKNDVSVKTKSTEIQTTGQTNFEKQKPNVSEHVTTKHQTTKENTTKEKRTKENTTKGQPLKTNEDKTTTTKEVTTTEPLICTNNDNHSIACGNMGRWFNSRSDIKTYVDGLMQEWAEKYDNGEITRQEYYDNCPQGYECWSCSYCGKWTGNLK